MSAYVHQQFCVGKGDQLKLTLRQHPDLPHLMLTFSFERAEFTLSAENDQVRTIVRQIAALFEGPALAPDEQRTVVHDGAQP